MAAPPASFDDVEVYNLMELGYIPMLDGLPQGVSYFRGVEYNMFSLMNEILFETKNRVKHGETVDGAIKSLDINLDSFPSDWKFVLGNYLQALRTVDAGIAGKLSSISKSGVSERYDARTAIGIYFNPLPSWAIGVVKDYISPIVASFYSKRYDLREENEWYKILTSAIFAATNGDNGKDFSSVTELVEDTYIELGKIVAKESYPVGWVIKWALVLLLVEVNVGAYAGTTEKQIKDAIHDYNTNNESGLANWTNILPDRVATLMNAAAKDYYTIPNTLIVAYKHTGNMESPYISLSVEPTTPTPIPGYGIPPYKSTIVSTPGPLYKAKPVTHVETFATELGGYKLYAVNALNSEFERINNVGGYPGKPMLPYAYYISDNKESATQYALVHKSYSPFDPYVLVFILEKLACVKIWNSGNMLDPKISMIAAVLKTNQVKDTHYYLLPSMIENLDPTTKTLTGDIRTIHAAALLNEGKAGPITKGIALIIKQFKDYNTGVSEVLKEYSNGTLEILGIERGKSKILKPSDRSSIGGLIPSAVGGEGGSKDFDAGRGLITNVSGLVYMTSTISEDSISALVAQFLVPMLSLCIDNKLALRSKNTCMLPPDSVVEFAKSIYDNMIYNDLATNVVLALSRCYLIGIGYLVANSLYGPLNDVPNLGPIKTELSNFYQKVGGKMDKVASLMPNARLGLVGDLIKDKDISHVSPGTRHIIDSLSPLDFPPMEAFSMTFRMCCLTAYNTVGAKKFADSVENITNKTWNTTDDEIGILTVVTDMIMNASIDAFSEQCRKYKIFYEALFDASPAVMRLYHSKSPAGSAKSAYYGISESISPQFGLSDSDIIQNFVVQLSRDFFQTMVFISSRNLRNEEALIAYIASKGLTVAIKQISDSIMAHGTDTNYHNMDSKIPNNSSYDGLTDDAQYLTQYEMTNPYGKFNLAPAPAPGTVVMNERRRLQEKDFYIMLSNPALMTKIGNAYRNHVTCTLLGKGDVSGLYSRIEPNGPFGGSHSVIMGYWNCASVADQYLVFDNLSGNATVQMFAFADSMNALIEEVMKTTTESVYENQIIKQLDKLGRIWNSISLLYKIPTIGKLDVGRNFVVDAGKSIGYMYMLTLVLYKHTSLFNYENTVSSVSTQIPPSEGQMLLDVALENIRYFLNHERNSTFVADVEYGPFDTVDHATKTDPILCCSAFNPVVSEFYIIACSTCYVNHGKLVRNFLTQMDAVKSTFFADELNVAVEFCMRLVSTTVQGNVMSAVPNYANAMANIGSASIDDLKKMGSGEMLLLSGMKSIETGPGASPQIVNILGLGADTAKLVYHFFLALVKASLLGITSYTTPGGKRTDLTYPSLGVTTDLVRVWEDMTWASLNEIIDSNNKAFDAQYIATCTIGNIDKIVEANYSDGIPFAVPTFIDFNTSFIASRNHQVNGAFVAATDVVNSKRGVYYTLAGPAIEPMAQTLMKALSNVLDELAPIINNGNVGSTKYGDAGYDAARKKHIDDFFMTETNVLTHRNNQKIGAKGIVYEYEKKAYEKIKTLGLKSQLVRDRTSALLNGDLPTAYKALPDYIKAKYRIVGTKYRATFGLAAEQRHTTEFETSKSSAKIASNAECVNDTGLSGIAESNKLNDLAPANAHQQETFETTETPVTTDYKTPVIDYTQVKVPRHVSGSKRVVRKLNYAPSSDINNIGDEDTQPMGATGGLPSPVPVMANTIYTPSLANKTEQVTASPSTPSTKKDNYTVTVRFGGFTPVSLKKK